MVSSRIIPIDPFFHHIVRLVMLYMNSKFSPRILSLVVSYMNEIYDKFLIRHPDFRGKVSLFSHSLGSVIAYDILKEVVGVSNPWRSQLKFPVENFFVVGSPISVFLGLDGMKLHGCCDRMADIPSASKVPESLVSCLVKLKCRSFYNIFHPDDPISYRIEPTICRYAHPKEPSLLPYNKGGLGAIQFGNLIQRLRMSFGNSEKFSEQVLEAAEIESSNYSDSHPNYVTPANTPDSQEDDGEESVCETVAVEQGKEDLNSAIDPIDTEFWLRRHFNDIGRVDFVLQTPMTLTPSLLNTIPAHMLYWGDDDVMSFIHNVLCKNKK
jgi:hypothetical protein